MAEYTTKDELTQPAEEVEAQDIPKTYWLPDAVYTALKWVVVIGLPAVGAFYSGLAGVWGWPCSTEVTQTCSYIALFLGALIGVSAIANQVRK